MAFDASSSSTSPAVCPELIWLVLAMAVTFEALPSLIKMFVRRVTPATEEELSAFKELADLKEEQKNISMLDEFAKYAKIDRKIIKIREKLKTSGTSRAESRQAAERAFNMTFYGIFALLYLGLMLSYSSCAATLLEPMWVFPLGYIVSAPTWSPGAVGILFWSHCCRTGVRSLHTLASRRLAAI